MNAIDINHIIDVQKSKGYPVFTHGDHPFNLNIVGVRAKERQANKFDDLFYVYWFYPTLKFKVYTGTVDPGTYWLEKPMNEKGCAILKPGYYTKLWKIGMHLGLYPALVQYAPCTVYRDNDKDNILDMVKEETGMFGINLHRTGMNGKIAVDQSSAGCQVIQDYNRYMNEFMPMVYEASKYWGPYFSYTLLQEEDFNEKH